MAQSQPKRLPTHRLYRVNGEGDKASWTQIGAAWQHKDGKGFSIACDAIPLAGRMALRLIEKTPAEGGQQ